MRCWRSTGLGIAAVLVGGLVVGCGDPYAGRYLFDPRPHASEIALPEADPEKPVRTLVTVVGVRRDRELGPLVLVRMRLENRSEKSVKLEPDSLALLSADLRRIGRPLAEPADPPPITPGGTQTVTVRFPFGEGRRPGDYDLSGLNLQWSVRAGDRALTRSATFARVESVRYRDRYHPYPPPGHFHFGYHHRFHRW